MTGPTPDRPGDSLTAMLQAAVGKSWPGGCDDCSAVQRIELVAGVFVVKVEHDDTCPWLTGATR